MSYSQKTLPTSKSIEIFLNEIPQEARKEDTKKLITIFQEVTGEQPVLWGNIVGFGSYHYKYQTGHEGDMCLAGFALRAKAITLYFYSGIDSLIEQLPKSLGKYKTGKGCLYIQKVSDIDTKMLRVLIKNSITQIKNNYPDTRK